ncbi:hypothetical protein OESDEN_10833 [Oesophagostomum dentatum]|uniref:ETS domain-containing protein n=1 Tax=Oesophagostomum dentatum TaxID=61180 RepID=A0A0B1T1Q1_OESDE|nr:hypothetical protein OESDEN_10833 [Oesophagostomum dentatum]
MNCNDQFYCASPEGVETYPSQPHSCGEPGPQYMTVPDPQCFDAGLPEQGAYPGKASTAYVLSSQEKVDFLKKCCASPVLRFILHLLSNPRHEGLVSWHGGPFGVKIWNTRKFTDCYNIAMGARMNFTNISRALQACEHITIAGVRLWKRKKQGEYSFFPCYTGHG